MTLKQIVMLISLTGPWMITCEKSYKDYNNLKKNGVGFGTDQSRLKSIGLDFINQQGNRNVIGTLKMIEVDFKHDPMQLVGQRKTMKMLEQEWKTILSTKYQSEELQRAINSFNNHQQVNLILERSNGF